MTSDAPKTTRDDNERMFREMYSAADPGERAAVRHRIIVANMGLAGQAVANYRRIRSAPKALEADLEAQSLMVLVRSVDKFRPGDGFCFSTYATWALLRELPRYVRRFSSPLTVAAGPATAAAKLRGGAAEPVPDAHLAPAAQAAMRKPVPIGEMLYPPADRRPGPDAEYEAEDERDALLARLRSLVDTLPPRQREVVALRYGLGGGPFLPLSEVGKRMGFTKERARQLEAVALQRMRVIARVRENRRARAAA